MLCGSTARHAEPDWSGMSDLIRREDAINALVEKGQSSKRYKLGEFWELNLLEIKEVLDALPSAETERTAKVKWYPHLTKLADGYCECGEDVQREWEYCPNCGARLEWE